MAKKPVADDTAPEAATVTPGVAITCTQPGFRRAGIPHPAHAEYPAGTFTAEQMEQLRAETKLIVVLSAAPASADETA